MDYTFVYYAATGERRRVLSRDPVALGNHAIEILTDLIDGRQADRGPLTTADRELFAGLRSIFREVGVAPLIGARRFVEAFKLLGSDLVLEAGLVLF